jgi:tungstate transport system substrate-binding protein
MRVILAFVFILLGAQAVAETVRLAVTTSFQNSGLADILLPQIKADTGLDVALLVVGTGQAIRLGQAGDVDAILVHSKSAEETFVAQGYGTHRREIMYNDFVLVGPASDLAQIADVSSATAALEKIAAHMAPFISRGDESGTHKKERALWEAAGLDRAGFGAWYKEVGSGMGASLNTAAGLDAYIMTDRASWLNFGNKGNLALLFAGDAALFNQYAYLPVNPKRHGHIKAQAAQVLEEWLVSDRAKALIDGYALNGTPLFVFNGVR